MKEGTDMISTKGRYALRVMIDLAEHINEGYVPLKDIATRQEISKKYLEIIMRGLVDGKLVTGLGGRGGGYRLCREPEEYMVGEILEAMEGSLAVVVCLCKNAAPCRRKSICKALPMWTEFNQIVHDYFYGKSLRDLL